MAIQQETGRFTLKNAIGTLAESISSLWKPALVAAPLIGTALFLASGTHAQTSGSATPTVTTTANGPVAPIAAPEAARTGRPKIKTKTASHTSRVASPPTTTAPVTQPEAARTGRPKERDPTPTNDSVASPPPATEPAATPTERRRRGPKVRDDSVSTRTGAPATQTPAPDTQPAGRRKEGPKGDHDHGRTATTPLMIGALGAATVLALVVSSGNDRPASP